MQPHTPRNSAITGRTSLRLFLLFACVAWFACLLPGQAYADCKPVIAALDKSAKEERRAMYSVDSPTQRPGGEPDAIMIGSDIYVQMFGKSIVTHAGSSRYAAGETTRTGEKKGTITCSNAGAGTYMGSAIDRYQIRSNEPIGDLANSVVWINRTSGLAVYQEIGNPGSGGYAWVYGAAVPNPDTAGAKSMKEALGKPLGMKSTTTKK